MRNKISYEWTVEKIDEHGDIIDSDFSETYPGVQPSGFDVGLVRDVGNDLDGLVDRSWAYIRDGKLEEFFTDGVVTVAKVPQRFHAEIAK